MNRILEPLTEPQREAVSHVEGPLLILAGPGSGKTRVVTHRIAFLLAQGIAPWQILGLTFTNKAADEMRLRLQHLAEGKAVWMGTFHRFCARLLRVHSSLVGLEANFSIYDTSDSRQALIRALAQADVSMTYGSPDQIAREISWAKNNLVTSDQYVPRPGNSLGFVVSEVYPLYQSSLRRANAVDFDDLLLHVACLLRDSPELRESLDERYRYILVDEYQDTNFAQYAIVRALSRDHTNLAATGDPDQSIYGWRGANLDNILKFEDDFSNVRIVRLEQNYRSSGNILRVADHLIAYNSLRKHKTLYTTKPPGSPVRLVEYVDSRDESEHIAGQIAEAIQQGRRRPRDFAIFYRVNSLSRSLETALRNIGVPFQIVKGLEFFERKEVKDVLAYLHLLHNPRNNVALLRIINTPPRKIGKTTIRRLSEYARLRSLSLLDAAREAGLIEGLPKRSAVHVAQFVAMYDRLCVHATSALADIVERVLADTGYVGWLEASSAEEDADRLGNLGELQSAAREFDEQHHDDNHLEAYLEQTSLVSDTDDWASINDNVSLMTLHAAKGLEFPVVFVVALEEGLLPHERSKDDPRQLEEERRLLFVGITRAGEELQLSYARRRAIRGDNRPTISSKFLMELPRQEMEVVQPTSASQWEQAAEQPDYEPDFEHQEVWREEIPARRGRKREAAEARLMTAAEMAGSLGSSAELAPDQFRQGMLITHPEFGLGKIVALSGNGRRRQARIQFFSAAREMTFVLVHSDLQPMKNLD